LSPHRAVVSRIVQLSCFLRITISKQSCWVAYGGEVYLSTIGLLLSCCVVKDVSTATVKTVRVQLHQTAITSPTDAARPALDCSLRAQDPVGYIHQ